MPIPFQIKTEIDKSTQDFIVSLFNEEDRINNLYDFINGTILKLKINLETIQNSESENLQLDKNEYQGQCKLELQQLLIGCPEHCPLCKKQCDVQHFEHEKQQDQIHECRNGHQLQAFGGAKSSLDNFAILQSCDDIKNNQTIIYQGRKQLWRDFKKQNNKWKLDSKDIDRNKNRQVNVDLWNLIGEDFCKIYNEQNLGIQFKQAQMISEVTLQKTHYILMLDESGSMKGSRWDNLMKALKKFLYDLVEDQDLKDNSWLTVIKYDDQCNTVFQKEVPDRDLIDQIGAPRFGLTNFENPLQEAYHICQRYQRDDIDKIVLYFMSDGEAPFPQIGVSLFIQADFIDKIEFNSIAYGSGAQKQILQKMADEFPIGKLIDAPNAEALAKTFKDIVPNIYQ